MTSLGQLCLLLAMICAGYSAFAAIVGTGARTADLYAAASARRWPRSRPSRSSSSCWLTPW